MKITNFDLVSIINTLERYEDKKLPQKISYAITRNLMLLETDREIYTKQLLKLFQEYDSYITKDENGENQMDKMGIPIIEDKEKNKEFLSQLADLLNIEIDVDMYRIDSETFYEVFSYDDYDKKYDAMSARDISMLDNILCDLGKEKDK